MQAFEALDTLDLIPAIYCEATELLQLPSLSLDPVAEKVQSNCQALETLICTVGRLDNQLSSFITSSSSSGGRTAIVDCANSAEVHSSSYATVASTILPPASAGASNSTSLSVRQDISPRRPLRSLNLVIFGLPESGSILDDKVIVDEAFKFLIDKCIARTCFA